MAEVEADSRVDEDEDDEDGRYLFGIERIITGEPCSAMLNMVSRVFFTVMEDGRRAYEHLETGRHVAHGRLQSSILHVQRSFLHGRGYHELHLPDRQDRADQLVVPFFPSATCNAMPSDLYSPVRPLSPSAAASTADPSPYNTPYSPPLSHSRSPTRSHPPILVLPRWSLPQTSGNCLFS